MTNSYWNEIISCRDDIYTLQRQLRSRTDNYKDSLDEGLTEEEALWFDLLRLIDLAKQEELKPNEAEELKEILAEVKQSRETIRQDIMRIFAN